MHIHRHQITAICLFGVLAAAAQAGVIGGMPSAPGASPGTVGLLPLPPVHGQEVNNDPNELVGNPFLIDGMRFEDFTPIDLVFPVTDSGGTTEYLPVILGIRNLTPLTWTGFEISIGFGYGDDFAPATDPTVDLDFSDPGFIPPDGDMFEVVAFESHRLLFGDASLPPDGTMNPTFSFDVPDHDVVPPAFHSTDGYDLTLRFQPYPPRGRTNPPPAIPEPHTGPLALLGLIGLATWALGRIPRLSGCRTRQVAGRPRP